MPEFDYVSEDEPLFEAEIPQGGVQTRSTQTSAGLFRTGAAVTIGAIPDLADSILASTTKILPGPDFERFSLTKQIPLANRQLKAVEAASGVIGLIAEATVGPKITALKSFDSIVKGNKVLRSLTASDDAVEIALRRVRDADKVIASRGDRGVDALKASIRTPDGGEITRGAIANQARLASLKRTLTQGVATEGLIALTLHENEFAVPGDSLTTLTAWAALGIALPAGFDQVAIGASMRRAIQSDAVRNARAKALDAGSGVDAIKAEASKKAFGQAASVTPKPQGDLQFRGHFADQAALEAIQLHARSTPVGDQRLLANRKEVATGNLKLANEALTKITTRGIRGSTDNGFSMVGVDTGNAERQTMLDLMRQNPLALQQIEEIGRLSDDAVANREKFLTDMEFSAGLQFVNPKASPEDLQRATNTLQQIGEARKFIPVVIENGEMFPFAHYQNRGTPFDGEIVTRPAKLAPGAFPPVGGKRAQNELFAPQTGISLSGASAKVTLPQNKSIPNLDFAEAQSLFALGRKFMNGFASGRTLDIESNASFFHLDLAETLLRERPHDVKIVFPKGMTRESAMVESFAQKVDIIRQQAGNVNIEDLPTLRLKLNLPGLTELQRAEIGLNGMTPAEALIFGGFKGADIRKMTLSDIQKIAAEARRKEGTLAAVGPDELDVLGTSLTVEGSPFIKGSNRPEVRPVLAFKRELGTSLFDQAAIANRRAETLSESFNSLINRNASSTVREVVGTLLQNLDAKTLTDLSLLDDTTQVASIGNSRIRRGIFSGQDVAAAGNQALLAAQRVFRITSTFFEKDYDNFIKSSGVGLKGRTIETIIGNIQRSDNTTSRLLVEQFVQARRGFKLSGKTVVANDGKTEFLLAQTSANRRQYEAVTGRPMPTKGAVLPLNNGARLGVDDKALEVINAFDKIADKLRADQNTILRASGLKEIKKEPFYIPGEQGRFNAFIMDANNQPLRMIIAHTAEQRANMITALRNDSASMLNRTPGAQVFTQEAIERELPLLNRALNDFLDPSIPYVQSVKGAERSGASASPFATGRGVSDVMRSFRNLANSNARRTIEVLFKPQIDEATTRAISASGRAKAAASSAIQSEASAKSTANTYLNSLLGRRSIDSPSSTVGKIVNPLEAALNVGLRNGYSVWTAVGGQRIEPGQHRKAFESAVTQLKARTPFSSANELLEERRLFKPPPEVGQLAGAFNDLATRLMLRYDAAHAVVTLAGIVTTFPSVAASLLPRVGESYAEVALRHGRSADVFVNSAGKPFTAWSVTKAAADSIRFMLNPKSSPDFLLAQKTGGLDAAIAEMHKELGQVHDTATWKVMARKADKIASTLSDKAEEMAVAWSYFTANKLFKDLGVTDDVLRASLSRQMVDQSIANFSPLNRPEIFQSPGVGSALGLFQTYMFNYYGRLFGYIENRQTRALAIQAAMQAQVFGLQTIPGMSQYNDAIFSMSAGKDDPMTALYNRFPQPVADALFYGVPSTVGTMFGIDRDSLPAISSRGSVDPRLPGTTSLPAGLNVMKNIVTGVGDGVTLFMRENPGINDQQVGEVLQRHVMNRPMSAMISMFWTDALVDGSGNLIAEETSSALGGIWRAMGFRTVAQAAEIEGFARFRGAEALRLQKRAALSKAMKGIFRDGDISESQLNNALRAFVRTGGTPSEFVGFLKSSAVSGLSTESDRALQSMLSNPEKLEARMGNILRLYNATHDTGVVEEELPEQ